MTARSIGELLSGTQLKTMRTFQPVRRSSYHQGEREHQVWQAIAATKQEARQAIALRLQAAEFYDRRNKQQGKRNGPLGHIALEVLRELYRIVDFKSGRLEPAIATICERIRRSRGAVVAAMARLKEHGFLKWIRRTEPLDNDGAGPQVRQIPNAYGFGLPERAAAWVMRKLSKGPPAACEVDRRDRDAQETDAMVATLPLDEQARVLAGDGELGDALARLGRSVGRSANLPSSQNPDPRSK